LRRALEEGCDHFSLYQLTIEPGTAYERLYTAGKLIIPDDDHARALWDVTQDVMGAAGLPAYEISNHARPGEQSRHNLIYWRYGAYAGVGPGAHGRLSVGGERRATVTERQPERWLQAVEAHGHGIVGEERLDAETQADEMLLMGLRLAEGIDMTRHARLAGRPLDPARIALLEAEGLVARAGDRLRVLPPGFPVLNAVIAQLA
jgi:coproporphyrinogen III oxidase-like Fe-S oxidoreductase